MTAEPVVPRVYDAIVRGALEVVPADRAVLLSRRAGAEIVIADPAAPDPSGEEIERLRHAEPNARASTPNQTGGSSLAVRTVGPEPSALLLERASGSAFTRYQVVRIAQEAMSNARRHASAGEIVVELHEDAGTLTLTVRDDGTGFDPVAVEGTGRFGLKTMAERARAVGGALEVVSANGAGTTVRARIALGGV